ncbi:uncharacterized protein LOC111701365 [Eurytemora carolleeae]|uniref:uncharacterized protein LOC111701365 n=1 Tax=Eurytemora carolleeae TaxID=1294199 RepID=UPI000C771B6A|nr:uncharacterized protein LOC111701365 [Eurytemora carolleeae]|eukprot:XP_023328387.1 uncharacterized protein LOC111701365 [Eurytemora affinis]
MEEQSVSMGWILILLFLLISSRSCEESSAKTCCQMSDSTSPICTSNSTCVIKFSDSNLLATSKHCSVIQDTKFENTNRSDTIKVDCIRSNFDVRQRFEETDTLPFHIELFNMEKDGESFIGFDVRLHYMEFVRARFRLMNLHHCKSPFGDISPECNPRCVKLTKNDKLDNQAFLSYDCESGFTQDLSGHIQPSTGDTYLFSMCMTDSGEGQTCGEYWFLVPPDTTVLDTSRPDHQVLLLVDRTEYDQNTEVVVYIPASHVIKHDADMLSVQLLHDSAEPMVEDPFVGEGCWHNKSTAAVIHVQNITFNKFPGHNIRGVLKIRSFGTMGVQI